MKVADLFAELGFKVDKASESRANKSIDTMKSALVGLGAFFGARAAGKALISFNENVEDTKNKIAGMLALTKKTDLADQLGVADELFANLQRRAASLPGTTEEYANMLGLLTQPVTAAGLGLQDLEDLTVNAVVAAKAFGVQWEVAARDIDQALRGQFHSVDQLTGKILGSMGFTGEEGRKRFNSKSSKERGEILKQALMQKQITQLAERQGNSFGGVLSTLKDAAQQFLAKVGIPLFKALGDAIRSANKWLGEHKDAVDRAAKAIGGVLSKAFSALRAVVEWFIDHEEVTTAVLVAIGAALTAFALKAAAAWIAATGPIALFIAAIAGVFLIINDLVKHFRGGRSKIIDTWNNLSSTIRGIVKGIAVTLAAPFLGVAAVVIAVKDQIVNAIESAITFVVDKIEWLAARARQVRDAILGDNTAQGQINFLGTGLGQDAQQRLQQMIAPQPQSLIPAGAAAGAAGNTLSIGSLTTNVNVPSGDPNAIADAIKRENSNMLRQAMDTLSGGRR